MKLRTALGLLSARLSPRRPPACASSPRLVTALDQIHDQGIELFLAGATGHPYCSLKLLLRDAKCRAGQDVSSSSESMYDDDEGGGPAQGGPGPADCSPFDPDGHRGSSRGGAGNGGVRSPGQVLLEVSLHPHVWGMEPFIQK